MDEDKNWRLAKQCGGLVSPSFLADDSLIKQKLKIKSVFKIALILTLSLLALLTAGFFFLKVQGPKLLSQGLANAFDSPVSVGSSTVSFPSTLRITGLEIGDFLKTDAKVKVSILSLFSPIKVLSLVYIDNLKLNLVKAQDGSFNLPVRKQQQGKPLNLIITHLKVKNGSVDYKDSRSGYTFKVEMIELLFKKRPAFSPIFDFDLAARVSDDHAAKPNLFSSGWIDWPAKDLQGSIRIVDLCSAAIGPIYKKIFGNSVSSAGFNFDAKMTSEDNDLRLDCQAFLLNNGCDKQNSVQSEPEGKSDKDVLALSDFFDIFRDDTGRVEVKFVLHTKLDNPRFEGFRLGTSVFENAARNLLKAKTK